MPLHVCTCLCMEDIDRLCMLDLYVCVLLGYMFVSFKCFQKDFKYFITE